MVEAHHPAPHHALWPESVKAHWKLFLVEGIVFIVLGALAVAVPILASVAVAIFLGWLFLIGGAVGIVATFMRRPHGRGFWWSLISGIVTFIAGLYLIGWPALGAVSLTIVLAAYFVADGIASMLFAYEHRHQPSSRWGWLFVNGITDLLLAGVIIWLLPIAPLWALGILIGFDFIFGGVGLVAMALAARHA